MLRDMLRGMLWPLEERWLRFSCWFIGHNERAGNALNYEEDYCDRCFVPWPQDLVTLPDLLMRAYGWMVERDWAWFNRLDTWLVERHAQRLPSWWSY